MHSMTKILPVPLHILKVQRNESPWLHGLVMTGLVMTGLVITGLVMTGLVLIVQQLPMDKGMQKLEEEKDTCYGNINLHYTYTA